MRAPAGTLLAAFCFYVLPSAALSAPSLQLKVASYNIRGFPPPLTSDRGQFDRMGELLANSRRQGTAPQILAIQEAWSYRGAVRKIVERAGYPHSAYGSRARFGRNFGSGLVILSEFPIEHIERTEYSDCVSWDCRATKGALLVRLKVPTLPVPVDLYNTHLNADPDSDPFVTVDACRQARMSQILELSDFIERTHLPGAVLMIVGDLNARADSDELLWLYGRSLAKNAMTQCLRREPACNGVSRGDRDEAIDHQFYRSGATHGGAVELTPASYERGFSEIFRGRPLSDHLSVDLTYELSWPDPKLATSSLE